MKYNKKLVIGSVIICVTVILVIVLMIINFSRSKPVVIDVEGSWVKLTDSGWEENLNATYISEHYLTKDKYVWRSYHQYMDKDIYIEKKVFDIREEDYEALLDYIINDVHLYDKKDLGYPNSAYLLEFEIQHQEDRLYMVRTGEKWEDEMLAGIYAYFKSIKQNGILVEEYYDEEYAKEMGLSKY